MRMRTDTFIVTAIAAISLLFISVYSQQAEPWAYHIIDNSSSGADGVRLDDVNHDGLLDITSGWEEGGVTKVYINPGFSAAREKWPAVIVGSSPDVEDAVFVDLDDDGAVDVISSCEGPTNTLFVNWAPAKPVNYLNSASWTTLAIPASIGRMQWMYCTPVQIDGQNGVDLVAGGKQEGAEIGWLESPQDPRRLSDYKYHKLCDIGWVMSIIAHDMDNDDDMDIVVSGKDEPPMGVFWLENPGYGETQYLPWQKHEVSPLEEKAKFIKIADLDSDGLLDLVVTASPAVVFYKRLDLSGELWASHSITFEGCTGSGKSLTVGDLDQDGREDIVFVRHETVVWLSYETDPTDSIWIAHEISDDYGIKFDRVEILDFDGDEDLDVLTCEENEGSGSVGIGVFWYENPLNPAVVKSRSADHSRFSLHSNYPNPFNPLTTVSYSVPEQMHLILEIYNILGEKVETLFEGSRGPGSYEICWDATHDRQALPDGVYIARLQAGSYSQSIRMVFLK